MQKQTPSDSVLNPSPSNAGEPVLSGGIFNGVRLSDLNTPNGPLGAISLGCEYVTLLVRHEHAKEYSIYEHIGGAWIFRVQKACIANA